LESFNFERREVGAKDVLIGILYCGVCHSDINQACAELGNSIYPMVPGHETAGLLLITKEDAIGWFKSCGYSIH
jgi:uncharacterized zinc-type alcohol dehydrogenase-like protein